MVRLMNRGAEGPPGDKYSPLYEHGKEETPVMVSSAIKTYSEDLRNLVLRCCSFDPNARPDLVALRDELEDLVDADGKGLDQGLRHDHLGDDEENLRLRYKPVLEGFAIKQ